MHRRIVQLILALSCGSAVSAQSQDFKVFDRTVQIHGFFSQGFVATNHNNWLTMDTSSGSGAMTDMGLNASSQINDKLRVGAQVYDRNLGQLGQYHPSLDWAYVDYRFHDWLGMRAGKVKTTLGLDNDTQDVDFLHTFALLPQSVYPTDLRDTTIAHLGGDIYGTVSVSRHLGKLAYTAYGGRRNDSIYSGYFYLASAGYVYLRQVSGPEYGFDLRWRMPVKGLLIGASRSNQEVTGQGKFVNFLDPQAGLVPYKQTSRAYWTNQFFGQLTAGKLHVHAEYRRFVQDQPYLTGADENTDIRGWYIAGSYRAAKRLEVGSYYSRFTESTVYTGILGEVDPPNTDTSLPQNHIYDTVLTGRVDLNRFWNVKVEGHFMDGYGFVSYPDGFYPQLNPTGFRPDTNAIMVRTSFAF